MAVRSSESASELIEQVVQRARQRLGSEQAARFVAQFYRWVPADDLAEREQVDLYGAAVTHWRLAQQRSPGEVKLHIYNPTAERHGWRSPHTVVEIVCDDMPFVVDSVTMELARLGHEIKLVIHPVIRIRRDQLGRLLEVLEPGEPAPDAIAESVLHAEIARESDRDQLERLKQGIRSVLGEVRAAVQDWGAMRDRALQCAQQLDANPDAGSPVPAEACEFLRWLTDDHFTFLGYREYEIHHQDGRALLVALPGSGLGILRGQPRRAFSELTARQRDLLATGEPLILTKANSRARVHRPSYLDYVGVKRFDGDGRPIGERRFLGLYTTAAYREPVREVPILRGKLRYVLERAGFPPDSHDAKALTEIVESYPRDSLFQIRPEELFEIAMGVLGLGERQRLRLFVHRDSLERFVSCLVCLPRDRFNTDNRERIEAMLVQAFCGSEVDWQLMLSESLLARVHYTIHTPNGIGEQDVAVLEARLADAIRDWGDDLAQELALKLGEERGTRLRRRYARAFPASYREDWAPRDAVADIERLERLRERSGPMVVLYHRLDERDSEPVRCKLYSTRAISLSEVLPTFEHMGARVTDERPHEITPADAPRAWIYDFGLRCQSSDIERSGELFQRALEAVWRGELEDGGLNALVLAAGMSAREVTLMRAIARYLRQAQIPFSNAYMQRTICSHPQIVRLMVALFYARFEPDARDEQRAAQLREQIDRAIDAVASLDEDRILRSFVAVIDATLRTSYFCAPPADGAPPAYGAPPADGAPPKRLSFKLDCERLALLPLPRPRFEIFVYSPRVEGVHLRGGKVARGGVRWSDRPEDFRTEILGLMKAQMVKNAMIVPVGAKGGFVVKQPPARGGREALQAEAVACYRTFLAGLLDLTDNIVEGQVRPPERVVRYDDDDPYLVVAADKGTATFSDIANEVAAAYGFWLGDAFASGGSHGYDHKQMGITARGAWESIKRHFRELGRDIQNADFTVVGIGDMSGDVFGNAMLLSRHIRLIGAFNHLHVFLDPDPDPETSYRERERLFALPRSGWDDYNPALISAGGGVWPRTAKSIPISPQARAALGIEAQELSPTELIRALLCAPVDLLFNGGIGTYVKASRESHLDVADKSNDAVRVNADELRCRVVGEGGNLGFTQLGRIEFAAAGGRINTDAIDNVAGVNCSDHEVNIKILLDGLVADGELTVKQRNALLEEMTDAVAQRVIEGSYLQTQALSVAVHQAPSLVEVHQRLVRHLEQRGELHRALEFLPSDEELVERRQDGRGLLAPELAVLMAYCKIDLYSQLLQSDLPEDPYLAFDDLRSYFPPPLPERYAPRMRSHQLRREIIATVVANQLVDRAGNSFIYRLAEETGASAASLARAFAVAREVFEMRSYWQQVEALDSRIEASLGLEMLLEGRKLVERATRWLVRSNPGSIDISFTIRYFKPGAELLAGAIPQLLSAEHRERFEAQTEQLVAAGVGEELARRTASLFWLLAAFDIVEVAEATGRPAPVVMETYFALGARLELDWLYERIIDLPRGNRWQALARAALRDDLTTLRRTLTREVLQAGGPSADASQALAAWMLGREARMERARRMIADIRAARAFDTTTLPVALREVRNLTSSGAGVSSRTESVTLVS
jgi:glutamate dehydrogenase